jgi:hypothetical protein
MPAHHDRIEDAASHDLQSHNFPHPWILNMWDVHSATWMKALSIAAGSTKLHIGAMLLQHHLIAPLSEATAGLDNRSVLGTPLHCALMGQDPLYNVVRGDRLRDLVDAEIIGPVVQAKATVKRLVDLGADVNVPFRLIDGQEISTTVIAHWTGHLEDVINAGPILDKQTIDEIFANKNLEHDEPQFLRNIDVHKLPERDQPAAVKLLSILGKTPEQTIDSLTERSFFTSDKRHMLLPEYEDALITAC